MNRSAFSKRAKAALLCYAVLAPVFVPQFLWAEKLKPISAEEVARSVIARLSHKSVTEPKVISHIDLTEPFGTITQWTFVVVQDGGHPIPDFEERGPIFLCLVKAGSPDCAEDLYRHVNNEQPRPETPYHLLAGSVVYAGQNKSSPLLLVKVCGQEGGNGNCEIATALYRYDREADRFNRVFLDVTGRNNNEATRFAGRGPLQGDLIVNYPTEDAPYTYWIEVYRAGESGRYVQILRYRGHTGYNDGNPLAVSDSEMPEILHRLGFWQPGDALPVPAEMPKGCIDLFMRQGEEWCKR
jgi:hypothetical protein